MQYPLSTFINNYLNDFLFVPIVLSLIQFLVRKIKNNKQFKIPTSAIIMIVIYYSLYFEYFMPKLNQRYTADLFDVLMYILGGLFFYLVENSSITKQKTRFN